MLKKTSDIRKTGILAVSFGTSHEDTRKKTIEAIEEEIAENYPQARVYRAWTSGMIIRKLEKSGYHVDTVTEAMERMKQDGITHVIVQPTHVLNGLENDIMKEEISSYEGEFSAVAFGDPLLTTEEDCQKTTELLIQEFSGVPKDTAVIFMGHGTEHYVNPVYAALDYRMKAMGQENIYFGTVEAYPDFETVLGLVKKAGYRKAVLAPFMIVAGDHAKNDMAGEEEDSWKNRLEQEGFQVQYVLKGLGEYEGIRQLFLEHIRRAKEEL